LEGSALKEINLCLLTSCPFRQVRTVAAVVDWRKRRKAWRGVGRRGRMIGKQPLAKALSPANRQETSHGKD
jgi:hypothetical protein